MTIVPVYNILLVPNATLYLRNDIYTAMSGRVPAVDEKVTLIVEKEPRKREELTSESFYPIGVSGVITEVHEEGYLAVRTGNRVNLEEVTVSPEYRIGHCRAGIEHYCHGPSSTA